MSDHMWEFAIVVIGFLLTGIGALLGMNLQSIKKCMKKLSERIDAQETIIASNSKDVQGMALLLSQCKVDCNRTFVTGEAFLRETGFMRRTLESQTASLNRVEGQLGVVENLPRICGDISRAIVSEMKKDVER